MSEKLAKVESVEATELPQSLAVRDVDVSPVMSLERAKERFKELQQFVKFYLKSGDDYGTILGTPKPTLYKPGADKLCDIYGLSDSYRILSHTANWETGLFDYEVECLLTSRKSGLPIRTGLGSCSSFESRYLFRNEKAKCPKCGKATIIKGKPEYGGGWLCWKKEGKSNGCGSKFKIDDPAISGQQVGKIRVEPDQLADIKNTVFKMARKRALVDACIAATRSSGLFTQDVADPEPPENSEREAKVAAEAQEVTKKHGLKSEPGTQAARDELVEKKLAKLRDDTGDCTGDVANQLKASLMQRRQAYKLAEELHQLPLGSERYTSKLDEFAKVLKLAPSKVEDALQEWLAKVDHDIAQKAKGLLTTAQQQRFHSIVGKWGWPDQQYSRILNELWAVPLDENRHASAKDIKAADFDEIGLHFDHKPPVTTEPPEDDTTPDPEPEDLPF